MEFNSPYLDNALDKAKVKLTVNKVIKLIEKYKLEFDTIVFRGVSGALIAPIIAYRLNKQLAVIRKPSDKSHSSVLLEGYSPGAFIIIDDLIDSGATIKTVLSAVKEHSPSANCVAIVLYRQWGDEKRKHEGIPTYSFLDPEKPLDRNSKPDTLKQSETIQKVEAFSVAVV
jgi:orotate phosphoribosyltransferase